MNIEEELARIDQLRRDHRMVRIVEPWKLLLVSAALGGGLFAIGIALGVWLFRAAGCR